jgi:6-phospho-beta-glucosidase
MAMLKHYCPKARVLNLTNPLSAFTAIMARELSFCVGLCELPAYTLSEAAAVLGVPETALDWQYLGLNHRGFILSIRHRGEDLLSQLPQRLAASTSYGPSPATIGGIDPDGITQLGALPLKYFRLCTHPQSRTPGRADFLSDLRVRLSTELRQDPTRSPRALQERYLEWYPRAVVPMLAALASDVSRTQVVNLPLEDGLVWELKVPVSRSGIGDPERVTPNPAVAAWLERFRLHELAFLHAVCSPSRAHLRQAVLADPAVPESRTDDVVCALEIELNRPSEVQDA